ncbi:MAG: DUF2520 domain-containing protein [Eubacterium sp.]|nr:DUF2520 domain-containing protein [Eubacterium sp.]
MKIGFYGAGRVGCTLGRYFTEHGLSVTGFYNRTRERAEEAARWTDTCSYDSVRSLLLENDALFLTVSDQAIPSAVEELMRSGSLSGKLLVHCSGALSSDVFVGTGAFGYSIHPLYAISDREKAYETLSNAFFTVEGDPQYLDFWCRTLTDIGLTCRTLGKEEKTRYHAAAVMASNLVCGLYAAAAKELRTCGFTPEEADQALAGLFLDNARGIAEKGPVGQLTGPLERGDASTVRGHLAVLQGEQRDLYLRLSRQVLEIAEKKNPDRDYTELNILTGRFEEKEGSDV